MEEDTTSTNPLLGGTKKPSKKRKSTRRSSATQVVTTTSTPKNTESLSQPSESPVNLNNYSAPVIFEPNEGPQTWFLAAPEREVLYGGAAGGGKSYAMLADPMRYLSHPQFSGLLLRHTTEELRELIWKSQELYPKIFPGIKWSERKMQWQHQNGGRLWMSYLDRDEDVLRYQEIGRAHV